MNYFPELYWTYAGQPAQITQIVGYEAARSGTSVNYSLQITLPPITGGYGYGIRCDVWLDGTKVVDDVTIKPYTTVRWTEPIIYNFGTFTVQNKLSGTTNLAVRVYSQDYIDPDDESWARRDKTYSYSLDVPLSIVTAQLTNSNWSSAVIGINNPMGYLYSIKYGNLYLKADGTTSSTEVKLTASSIPVYSKTDYLPDSTHRSKDITFTIATYNGTTLVGSINLTVTFNLSIEDSKPLLTATIVDVNTITSTLTGDNAKLILGYSNAQVTLHATPKYGATITSTRVNGQNGPTVTFTATTWDIYSCTAWDSRLIGVTYNTSPTVVSYNKPTIQGNTERKDATSGLLTTNFSGTCWNHSFGATNNEIVFLYRKKLSSSSTWGNWTSTIITATNDTWTYTSDLSGFDYDKSWDVLVLIADKLDSQTLTFYIPKSEPVADWDDLWFLFNTPVTMTSDLTFANFANIFGLRAVIKNESVNLNSITETNLYVHTTPNIACTNTPAGCETNTWYLAVILMLSSSTDNELQIFIPVWSATTPIFIRLRNGGTWQLWRLL